MESHHSTFEENISGYTGSNELVNTSINNSDIGVDSISSYDRKLNVQLLNSIK